VIEVLGSAEAARARAMAGAPVLYSHVGFERSGSEVVIGWRSPGLFEEADGSYVVVGHTPDGSSLVDRDGFGSVPLYYREDLAAVSTDLRFLLELRPTPLDPDGVAEYLASSFTTCGATVHRGVRVLEPDELVVVSGSSIRVERKPLFGDCTIDDPREACELLRAAIERSIRSVSARCAGGFALNLSGGVDSTLALALLANDRPDRVVTTTFFHDDWREDLDDWRWAATAADQFGSDHRLARIDNAAFTASHRALVEGSGTVWHTYAAAFRLQNLLAPASLPIVNGSGPDESMVGTEKVPVDDLLARRSLPRDAWVDELFRGFDAAKLDASDVGSLVPGSTGAWARHRRSLAGRLADAPDFVELQRRYHAMTVLQDHIRELSAVAASLGRPVLFPYLTNDVFRVVFGSRFAALNVGGTYKAVMKQLLAEHASSELVHRAKVGFQSPSRPYFRSTTGLGAALPPLLARRGSVMDVGVLAPAVRERLDAPLDVRRSYDFLEWNAYNVLLLESLGDAELARA
jgi:asparagine synthetase B (glutamine-hydrolysing)